MNDPLVLLVSLALVLSASLSRLKAGVLGAGRLLTELLCLCTVVNVPMGTLLQRILSEMEVLPAVQVDR